jgi:mRNA-degrading endonuclease RelE of RelBE toxin-antitoxin system
VSYKIIYTSEFEKEIKKLSKKYLSLKKDFNLLLETLAANPKTGTPLGNDCFKIRLSVTSKGRGKSGGARVITHVAVIKETIILISIYDKSELSAITDVEIKARLRKFIK